MMMMGRRWMFPIYGALHLLPTLLFKPRVAMRAPATRSGVLATARVLLSAGRNTRDWRVIDRRDMVFLWQVGGIFPDFQQPHSALSSVLSAYFL